jgi:hypothetical protein
MTAGCSAVRDTAVHRYCARHSTAPTHTNTRWGICYGIILHASSEACVVHQVKSDLHNAQYQTQWHSLWFLLKSPWFLSVISYLLKQNSG